MMYKLEKLWLALISITIFNVAIAEGIPPTLWVSLVIACTTCYKGLVVIDHFMELKEGNLYLRRMMRVYFLIFPSLIVLTYLFPEALASLTSLS